MKGPRRVKRGAKGRRAFQEEVNTPSIDAAYAATLETKQERVEYLADLMAAGNYVTRKTARELAEAWELAVVTVEHEYCAHAATLLRASLGAMESLQTRCVATMDRINAECLKFGRELEDDPLAAAKFYEVALQATVGMLAFTSTEFDHELSRQKEKRDAEKHARDMGTTDVKEVRLIIEEAAIPPPKDESGSGGA